MPSAVKGKRGEQRVRSITKVLLVDDDQQQLRLWEQQCARAGRVPLVARNLAEATRIAYCEKPGMAFVDYFIPDLQGARIVTDLKRIDSAMFVLAVSGYMTVEHSCQCMRAGAADCFLKPISCRELIDYAEVGKRPLSKRRDIPTAAEVEWAHIARVFADCGGNLSRSAELLGLSRKTVERRIHDRVPGSLCCGPVRRRARATITPEEIHAC